MLFNTKLLWIIHASFWGLLEAFAIWSVCDVNFDILDRALILSSIPFEWEHCTCRADSLLLMGNRYTFPFESHCCVYFMCNQQQHKSYINMVVYIWIYLQSMVKLIFYSLKNVKYTNWNIRNKLSTSTQTRLVLPYYVNIYTTDLIFFIKYK